MKRRSLQLMMRLELIISILAWISALLCLMLLIWMIVAKANLIFLAIFVAYKVDKRSRKELTKSNQKDIDSDD